MDPIYTAEQLSNLEGVYLLHYAQRIGKLDGHNKGVQHYIGYAENISERVALHAMGRSRARLPEVFAERGIPFVVAQVWPGADRTTERKIKNRKELPRLCPVCNAKVQANELPIPVSISQYETVEIPF